MYDFLEQNAMYIVLLIALIIWAGLFGYLYKIDGNLKKLEGEENDK
jgi:CcmD family protein